ncbi:MAG TPA: hypothetical protein PKU75_00615, partial [Tetrasphaera australiensis]|nr:hypothetical protein [Tetrasphaera australiensis]
MASSKLGKGALAASAAGLLIAGGGAIAYAATGDSTSTTTPTSTASSSTSSGLPSLDNGQGANNGQNNGQTGQQAPQGGMGRGGMGDGQGMGGHAHTAVTGDELTKVKDAIKAKDSAVTITQVMKDEDGSYDAFGTKDGQMVRVEVSADLKTVEVGRGGMGRGGMGDGQGMGGHAHTAVTGDELTKVKDAIKAKDSAVTITQVMKDEDGSYDAFGTKDGQMVRVEVSADLKTVEVGQGGPGMGRGGMGGHHGGGMPGQ